MADFVDEIERCPHGIDYNYDCDACIDEALRENHEAGGHADEARDFCPLCIRDALVRVGAPASEVLPALAHVAAEAAEDAEQQQLECLGHESVSGPAGVTVYCDGSCRAKEAR